MQDVGRLVLIPALHLASGVLLGGYCIATGGRIRGIALEHFPLAALLALVFGQACLLGCWAAFSGASRRARLAGLVAGAAGLEGLVAFGIDDGDDFRFMASMAAGVVAAALLAVRRGRAELQRIPAEGPGPAPEGFRFSIRGLMLFTLAVALVVGAARGARQSYGHLGPSLVVAAVWSLGFVVLALAAVWAALGRERPAARVAVVLACAAALGALFAYGVGEDRRWEHIAYFVIITAGQSAVLAGTLLAIRWAGYRLVGNQPPRLKDEQAGQAP